MLQCKLVRHRKAKRFLHWRQALPSSGAATLNKLACLAERVACYWLDLEHNLSDVPNRDIDLLDRNCQ
jgi:hypothetical protein